MDQSTKKVIAMAIIMVVVTIGFVIYFNNRFSSDVVVSQIDGFDFVIDDTDNNALNVTFRFDVTIENYGEIRDVTIPCATIQNYLSVKNSSIPISDEIETFNNVTSYILDTTYTEGVCDPKSTVITISENIIDEIVVAIPFRIVSGSYSFIWFNSLADTFLAIKIDVDVSKGENGISYIFEADVLS